MRRAVLLLALAACGGGDRWSNALHTQRTTLAEVRAPHEPVVVRTSGGLYRVYLDSGERQQVIGTDAAVPLDATATLDVEAGHYVVNRVGAAKLVIQDVTPQNYVHVAPDHKHIALAEDKTIIVADVADGSVRRFEVPAGTRAMHWASTSDALVVENDDAASVDIATGAITPIAHVDDLEWMQRRSPKLACPAHGFELQERTQGHEQQIVLVPTASTANPEELTSLETRVLVRATDKSGHSGDGAINLGKKNPEPLALELLLPSCEHFVFSLEGKTYVGNIATGAIAFVSFGWNAVR